MHINIQKKNVARPHCWVGQSSILSPRAQRGRNKMDQDLKHGCKKRQMRVPFIAMTCSGRDQCDRYSKYATEGAWALTKKASRWHARRKEGENVTGLTMKSYAWKVERKYI